MADELKTFNRFVNAIYKNRPFTYDFRDKDSCINQHILYMLSRTQSMFKWTGLPDSIPQRILELYLQINGNVCFYEYQGRPYVFTGGLGGEPDVYYRPTLYTIANPALDLSANLVIDRDCVLMRNDSTMLGLMPMFSRYSAMLTDTELSMYDALINSRAVSLISAQDDRTRASAEKYLEDLEKGKLGVIAETPILDGVRVQPYSQSTVGNSLITLIEVMQYNKASWFNELGLNANYNMKRESLNSNESQLNDDALLPLVDDMLSCRQEGIEKVNAMYGLNISVSLNSSWEDNQIETDKLQDELGGDDIEQETVD